MEKIDIEFKPVGLSLETDVEHFALALKMWRIRRGISQREAAEICNVSRHSILRAEAGNPSSWKVLYRIFSVMSDDLK